MRLQVPNLRCCLGADGQPRVHRMVCQIVYLTSKVQCPIKPRSLHRPPESILCSRFHTLVRLQRFVCGCQSETKCPDGIGR